MLLYNLVHGASDNIEFNPNMSLFYLRSLSLHLELENLLKDLCLTKNVGAFHKEVLIG